MGFLRGRDRPDGEQIVTATALVVEATPPPEGGPNPLARFGEHFLRRRRFT
jgi:hypothetical protein